MGKSDTAILPDFRTAIIDAIEADYPALLGKVQCGAVDEGTTAPFATFGTPEERPLRTKDGIAGSDTLFEVEVFSSTVVQAEYLKRKAIAAVDGLRFGGQGCRYRGASSDYYPDYDLHSWTLTFKVT